jgi:hypothetical protein
MGGARSPNGQKRNAYRLLVRKTPLGRPRHRWEDNIKMNLGEMRWDGWTGLVSLRIGSSGELLRMW